MRKQVTKAGPIFMDSDRGVTYLGARGVIADVVGLMFEIGENESGVNIAPGFYFLRD